MPVSIRTCVGPLVPGSATLDPNILGDSLVSVVDNARKLEETLGLRQFIVSFLSVTPAPRRAGPVNPTITETILDPAPCVKMWTKSGSMKLVGEECGLDEDGLVMIEEVSLTYTEPELTGKDLPTNSEFFWKIVDAHTQQTCVRYFTLAKPPFPDRGCCPGWTVWLKRAEGPSNA